MSSVVIAGDTSGSVTLQAPAVAGSTVLTLPAVSGTVITSGSPQSGGVIQVVNATYSTQTSTSSNVGTDTGLTATITPKFSTSKILVLADITGLGKDTNNAYVGLTLIRGATAIVVFEKQAGWTNTTAYNGVGGSSINYLDSPATTSATTYKVQFYSTSNLANVYVQLSGSTSTITLMEIAI